MAAVNPGNAHAHLVWGLTAPVLVDSPDMRQGPLRYLCAVEAAYRVALGADAGYTGLLTKNPAHARWRTLRGPQMAYELGELAEYVDLSKHIPKGRKVEEVGVGRNVTVFDRLRRWAYVAIRRHREHRNFVLWQAEGYDKALEMNGAFCSHLIRARSGTSLRASAGGRGASTQMCTPNSSSGRRTRERRGLRNGGATMRTNRPARG